MVKFKLGATIPVAQYSNIQPEFEVEAETYEEAIAIAEAQLLPIWNKYVEPGKELKTTQGKLIKGFVGGEIYFDEATHTYTWGGEVYLSASKHAKKFEKPFDARQISEAMAKNVDFTPEDIRAMWELKSQTSKDLGHAIHAAIELHGKYIGLSKALDAHRATKEQKAKNTHLHDHPTLRPIIEGFYALQDKSEAVYEALVIDHTNKQVARADRLRLVGNRQIVVQDIKTNVDITKSIDSYWEQTKFIANILERNDYKVLGLELYCWDGEWKKYEKEFDFNAVEQLKDKDNHVV